MSTRCLLWSTTARRSARRVTHRALRLQAHRLPRLDHAQSRWAGNLLSRAGLRGGVGLRWKARSALNKEWVGAGRTPTRPSLRRLGQTSGVDNVVVVPADSSLVVVWMPASGAVDMPLAVRPGPRPRPGGSGRA